MEGNHKIQDILQKILLGNVLTNEEQEVLDTWRNLSRENERIYKDIHDLDKIKEGVLEQQSFSKEIAESWQVIKEVIHKGASPVVHMPARRKWIRVSVVAASLIICTLSAYLWINHRATQPIVEDNRVHHTEFNPGGAATAILKLASGQVIALDSQNNGQLVKEGISKSNDVLSYAGNENGYATQKENELIIPRGSFFRLVLADGTTVVLNADSKIRYPMAFNNKERRVILEGGEAYFEVTKKGIPFIVELSSGETVEVLGTHFNVADYMSDKKKSVTLLEGKVKVTAKGDRSVILAPGQQTVIQNGAASDPLNVNAEAFIGWTQNRFVFEDADIRDVMAEISRWYDLDIKIEGKFTKKLNASVPRNLPAVALLQGLREVGGPNFTIEGNQIRVFP